MLSVEKDDALVPCEVRTEELSAFADGRTWQGIPGITGTPDGALWATFYSGASDEGLGNYALLAMSRDGGASWSDPVAVVPPRGAVRAFDPCVWTDPSGRLWWFWAQSFGWYDGRAGVFASVHDPENGRWSPARRLADGVMLNKPTVLSTGEWLLPTAVWRTRHSDLNRLEDLEYSNVLVSRDAGRTFALLGHADVPGRYFDEHSVIERSDGMLDMYVRCLTGIGRARSADRGTTWHTEAAVVMPGPNSRIHVRTLDSGALLMIRHDDDSVRRRLAAFISDDDGWTWSGGLLLDDRDEVSYPDGFQDEAGLVHVVWDHDRYGSAEVLTVAVTESEIRRGGSLSDTGRPPVPVSALR